jgi:glycerol 3-phosphatase-2
MKTAVILAAGIGSRLRPLTSDKPKCMVRAAGRPIVDYQLSAYEKAGFDHVYIIGGFRIDVLRSWLASRPTRLDVQLIENYEFDTTNNMYSLSLLQEKLQGHSFYLSNGDVVFDATILDEVGRAAADTSCIAVDKGCFIEESMKVVMDPSGRLNGLSKRYTKDESYAVSIDLYRFSEKASRQLFQKIDVLVSKRQERSHWTEVAIDEILRTDGHDFYPVDIASRPWVEVDNLEDLAQADFLFSPHRQAIAKAKALVFDLGGRLIIDGKPIPAAIEAVQQLQKEKTVLFCTNNSSRSRQEFAESLTSYGIACGADSILSSTGATIAFLHGRRIGSLFVLGTPALQKELETAGFTLTETKPDMVVIGFDKTLTFARAAHATNLIARGCPYILTHPDVACPTSTGPIPDAGAIGAMIRAATNIAPLAVLGKPSREMLLPLFEEKKFQPKEVVVIGDRLSTDVQMAKNTGCLSVLVLSGITSRLEAEQNDITPSLILPNAGRIADIKTA